MDRTTIFPSLLLLLTISSCTLYQKYEPRVTRPSGGYYVDPDVMTEEHKQNIILVMKYYRVRWKEKNGDIYMEKRVKEEIMWNFTTKANDPEWLKAHPPDFWDDKVPRKHRMYPKE